MNMYEGLSEEQKTIVNTPLKDMNDIKKITWNTVFGVISENEVKNKRQELKNIKFPNK